MESQTKHRILGILVILGLIVILMPLFDSSSEPKSEVALVNSPPFPDQAVTLDNSDIQKPILTQQASSDGADVAIREVTEAPHPDDVTLPVTATTDTPPSVMDGGEVAANPVSAAPTPISTPEHTPATALTSLNKSSDSLASAESASPDSASIKTTKPAAITDQHKTVNRISVKPAAISKSPKIVKDHSAALSSIKKSVAVVDQLSKLKQAAWVIQIGSYKNKANALRLVNQLRSNGYTAFIQDVSSEDGRHTRVYVGPESKRKAALSLVEQINKDMNLQGIVISYQPLAI